MLCVPTFQPVHSLSRCRKIRCDSPRHILGSPGGWRGLHFAFSTTPSITHRAGALRSLEARDCFRGFQRPEFVKSADKSQIL